MCAQYKIDDIVMKELKEKIIERKKEYDNLLDEYLYKDIKGIVVNYL